MSAPAKTTNILIANGTSESAAVPINGNIPLGLLIPSAWTTANITFQASVDDTNFADVYDNSGNELTVTVGGAARYIALDQTFFVGFSSIKLRSGTTGSPVNQGADRALVLVTKGF